MGMCGIGEQTYEKSKTAIEVLVIRLSCCVALMNILLGD